MVIKEKLVAEYPLKNKKECLFECYEVIKRRYVIFYDKKVNRDNIEGLLDKYNIEFNNGNFSKVRTIIVVAETDDQFDKEDLVFFNGVDTFVVYYLINNSSKELYFNDQISLWFSIGWAKIIRKFNKILNVPFPLSQAQ